MAKVDVVIPCYNYGRFLEECVRSVLTQDLGVRVLIIDDASSDDSASVAMKLAEADPRVSVIVHTQNRGHIATYNEGLLDWADAEYSVLLSADDVLTPGSLTRAVAVLDANPSVGMVYGHAAFWKAGEPRPVPRLKATGATVWPRQRWLRIVCHLAHAVTSTPGVVVRTSVQQSIGGYRPELPHTGDVEMWMRFAVHSDIAYVQGVDQAWYRIHDTNMTTQRVPVVDLRQRKAAYDYLFANYGALIADAEYLKQGVDRKMAKEALWRACSAYHRGRMDSTPVAELIDFARSTYAEFDRLPEYWGLRWRQYLGPEICPYLQPLMLSAVYRRVRDWLWWRTWKLRGV
ncbi:MULTISPECIES: glycosyltransferase family 2 protein [unclassified Bradyrhizobium]|uniref:glycosyltransferase family 2 protein n=1 Tax=unclassified Bradyrhizobium TaxID=2631580 RepID=UPI002FF15782